MSAKPLVIAGKTFGSRLFTGSGKFGDHDLMRLALEASGSELVTVALRRVDVKNPEDDLLRHIPKSMALLPNTSGARDAKEAIFAAELAREALSTNWVKLEIHPDPRHLMPDPIETLLATEALVKKGFVVMPYVHADPSLCKRLEDVGAPCVMPLAAPIGSFGGLQMRDMLRIIIAESRVPVVIDAGIGAPSHAAEAMEMGADAVLINTAMAAAGDVVAMAKAFRLAVEAGRGAFEAGLPRAAVPAVARASSPLTGFLSK